MVGCPKKAAISSLLISHRHLRRLCAATLFVAASSQTAPIPEYQAKAGFLFNSAQFVGWPSSQAPDTPLVIGILGDDPFGSYLDETVRGQEVNNRPLTIHRFRGGTEHIVHKPFKFFQPSCRNDNGIPPSVDVLRDTQETAARILL